MNNIDAIAREAALACIGETGSTKEAIIADAIRRAIAIEPPPQFVEMVERFNVQAVMERDELKREVRRLGSNICLHHNDADRVRSQDLCPVCLMIKEAREAQ